MSPLVSPLPPVPVDLFTRAAAIVAVRAARGEATQEQVEEVVARGIAQSRALAEGSR